MMSSEMSVGSGEILGGMESAGRTEPGWRGRDMARRRPGPREVTVGVMPRGETFERPPDRERRRGCRLGVASCRHVGPDITVVSLPASARNSLLWSVDDLEW